MNSGLDQEVLIDYAEVEDLSRDVPVRLRLRGQEVLGWDEEDPYMVLPLFRFAFEGLFALKAVRNYGRYLLELGLYGDTGELLLAQVDDDVVIHHPGYERTGRATMTVLEAEWEKFVERIAEAWSEPQILVHPEG